MDALAPLWQIGTVPDLDKRIDVISKFAKNIRSYGPTNFIYADGYVLLVPGHERIQVDGKIDPPGNFKLSRFCQSEKSMAVAKTELQKSDNKV